MKKMTVKLMMLLIIPALFASWTQPAEVPPGYEGTRLNPNFLADVEIVSALLNACIQGDRDGMELYLHENFSSDGPGPESFTRQEEIEKWLNFSKLNDNAKFSNIIFYSWVVDELENNPNLVGTWVAVWHNFSFRTKADGREVRFPAHLALRIREGKVDFALHHYDQLSVYRQMGYRLLPPEPAEE